MRTAAGAPLTVVSVNRRGIVIGIGKKTQVPSLTHQEDDKFSLELDKKVEGFAKELIYDPEDGTWFYSYLSNGLPNRGELIGLGERGKVVYYKVSRVSPTLVQLVLDKSQVFPSGSSVTDFASEITIDSKTFKNLRAPTWYRQIRITSKMIEKNPAIQKLLSAAKELAVRAYKQYQVEKPEEAQGEKPLITQYTSSLTKYNILKGMFEANRELLEWLGSLDGDPRLRAKIINYVTTSVERLSNELEKAQSNVKDYHKSMVGRYPELRSASTSKRLR